jgi:hypothetical protein
MWKVVVMMKAPRCIISCTTYPAEESFTYRLFLECFICFPGNAVFLADMFNSGIIYWRKLDEERDGVELLARWREFHG